jgi:dTDP-4-amino-4,6-dideoxygalactose transaminase
VKVPFVDLQLQYRQHRDEFVSAMEKVCERAAFILGEEVDAFEKSFAGFCGAKECVGVASGCDALLWAIKACGIGPGDEVITVANTYIATALAISFAGATPVLVDCRNDSYEIDPDRVRQAITRKTKAILPVHLYGQAADMDAILTMAKDHNLKVIEDACQAHGAMYKGRACGTIGDVGCFSFYPGKNLGAYGDGGAVVTSNREIADKVRMFRNYGQKKKYYHDTIGWNSRLDTVQAAVLSVKLKNLESWNNARRRHADSYRKKLQGLPLTLPVEMAGNKHVYHLFVVQVERRDELLEFLKTKDVSCGIHYPVPIHLQEAYRQLGLREGSFPVTEKTTRKLLSLPMYPELTEEQIDYTCLCIREFLTTR